MISGGSDDSGDGNCGNGSEPTQPPSRRKQFLGFVALSEWLLQQLGSGGIEGVRDGQGHSPADIYAAPTIICGNILRGCHIG